MTLFRQTLINNLQRASPQTTAVKIVAFTRPQPNHLTGLSASPLLCKRAASALTLLIIAGPPYH